MRRTLGCDGAKTSMPVQVSGMDSNVAENE
jgi:hypothetical protein